LDSPGDTHSTQPDTETAQIGWQQTPFCRKVPILYIQKTCSILCEK
jgi:hypothetical protein